MNAHVTNAERVAATFERCSNPECGVLLNPHDNNHICAESITRGQFVRELRAVADEHEATIRAMNRHGAFSASPAKRLFGSWIAAKIAAGLIEATPATLVRGTLRERLDPGETGYLRSRAIADDADLTKRAVGQVLGRMASGDVAAEAFAIEKWANAPAKWQIARVGEGGEP